MAVAMHLCAMPRLRPLLALILTLVLAFLPLAQVQGSWSCPDGTRCVWQAGEGYSCAVRGPQGPSCCLSRLPRLCRHGALPGAGRRGTSEPAYQGKEQCRYAPPPSLDAASNRWLHGGSSPPNVEPALPGEALTGFGHRISCPTRTEDGWSYRPPPLIPAGPPRGPPTA